MKLCTAENCTGCMACYNICPVGAISISQDRKGFYVPEIHDAKCIHCNQCVSICPELRHSRGQPPQSVLACWARNDVLRQASTSGGIFSGLAAETFRRGGVVCGVCLDHNLVARHVIVENIEKLTPLRGSKYVQSDVGNVMNACKQHLEAEKQVFFTGTPCQVAGFKNFLGHGYENLLTADIICHGVPSPLVFDKYLRFIESTYLKKIMSVQFRYKKPGWTVFSMQIVFEDQSEYIADSMTDPYLIAFLKDYISRDCCARCRYAVDWRQGDLTIADFWGYVSDKWATRNTEKGISLVLQNTAKGIEALDAIAKNYIIVEKTMEEAKSGNQCLSRPYPPNKETEKFWRKFLSDEKFEDVLKEYLYPRKRSKWHEVSRFIDDKSYLIPNGLRVQYDKFKQQKKAKST